MAFATIGIRLLADGLGPFTANLMAARRQISFIGSRGITPVTSASRSASTALTDFGNAINAPSRAIKSFGNTITNVGTQVRRFGNEMTAMGFRLGFVAAGFVGVGVAAARTASEFETAIAQIAVITDVGIAGAREFGQEILRVAAEVGQLPTDLADAGYFITSTGITNIQLATDILTSAAKASSVGLGEVDEVARALTATITAYGEAVITPAQATDQLFEAVKRGGVEATELAPALSKVLPLAAAMGVSFAEATAFMTTFTIGGASASTAATALQRTLLAIEKPTVGSSEAFAKLGFVVNDTTNEFRELMREQGLAVALGTIRQRAEEAGVELAQVFGRVTALTGTLFVTSEAQLGHYLETLEAIKNSAGGTEAAFQVVAQTTEFQFNRLRATLQATGIQIGSILLPAINQIIDRVAPLIVAIGELAAQNPKLVLLATGFSVVALAASGLLIVGGFLVSAIGSIVAAAGTLIAAFGAMLSPIGLVIAAIATLAGLFALSFDTMQEKILRTTIVTTDASRSIGNSLASGIGNGAKSATKQFTEMQDKLAQVAAQTATNAKDWGGNIVVQFARGMAQAAVAVVNVLIQIGRTIRSWLAPGSPPRLLPDLPAWGANAMNEFMGGWLKGDFSVFNDIASLTESFFRSLGDDLGEGNLIPAILGSRSAIADAVEQMRTTGTVAQATLAAIGGSFGATSQQVQEYVLLMLQLKQATDAVNAAQEEVNRITNQYADTLRPIDSELEDIADRRQNVVDQLREEELQAILSQENIDPLAKELALMELREIELKRQKRTVEDQRDVELEAANERLEAAELAAQQIQDQIDAQKALIQFQIDTNNLLNEQADAMEQLGESIKEAAGSIGDAAEALGEFGEFAGGAGDFENILPDLDELGEGGLLGAIGSDINKAVEEIKDDVFGLFDAIKAEFDPLTGLIAELKDVWSDIFILFGENKGKIIDIAIEIGALTTAFLLFKTVLAGIALIPTLAAVGGAVKGVATAIAGFRTAVGLASLATGATGFKGVLLGIVAVLGGPLTIAVGAAALAVGALLIKFGGFKGAADAVRENFSGSGTFGSEGIIATALDMITDRTSEWVAETATSMTTWSNETEARFNTWSANVGLTFATWKENTKLAIINWATDTSTSFTNWISGIHQSFLDWSAGVDTTIQTWAANTLLSFTTWVGDVDTQFIAWRDNIILKAGEMAQGVLATVDSFAASWFDAGASIVQGFIDGISSKVMALIGKVRSVAASALSAWNTFWGSQSPSTVAYESSTDVMQGFINGINALAPVLQNALVTATSVTAPTVSQPTASMPAAAMVDNRVGAQFGDVNVNNGMDLAAFEAIVARIVNGMI